MVQWLRACFAVQRTWVRSLVRELRIYVSQGNQAHVAQLLSPGAAEPMHRNERSPCAAVKAQRSRRKQKRDTGEVDLSSKKTGGGY